MKIMTILGTRPEIIRLCLVMKRLDECAEHVMVHTGQNYDDRLNRIFFEDLEVRPPDELMSVRASSFAAQIGQIMEHSERLLLKHRPDRLLILGDTNSGIAALVARRMGVPVYHMEAGNRCFDDRVPEEVNRRVIDHSSSILMPYTEQSRSNLRAEGFPNRRIYVTGNPILEVIDRFRARIDDSDALQKVGVEKGKYFLVTMHRAENVDIEERLRALVDALSALHEEYGYPVICSFHPRTLSKVEAFGVDLDRAGLHFLKPFGFFDFVKLEQEAFCVLTDSGTVQEETCIFGVPNVTIRDVTERPETVECGSNILAGAELEQIVAAVRMVVTQRGAWTPPSEYLVPNVSAIVTRILLSYRLPGPAELSWRDAS